MRGEKKRGRVGRYVVYDRLTVLLASMLQAIGSITRGALHALKSMHIPPMQKKMRI